MATRHILALCGALCLLLVAGCASHSRDLSAVRAALLSGDVDQAVAQFEERKEKNSDLLYLLERGYMMHLAGRWEESNTAFEAAEQRADELYTKSVSRQAAALFTSDLALPYRGMPYELQLIQYYRALNYLELDRLSDALVEARKANFKLTLYREKNPDDAAFRQDAFLQYFTGLLYEAEQEVNDAVVSFRDAGVLYRQYESEYGTRAPTWLAEDFYASLEHLGLSSEMDSLVREDSTLPDRAALHDDYNLVLFFESGFVPYREPVDITLPIYDVEEDDEEGDEKERKRRAAHHYVTRYGHDVYSYRAGKVKLDHVLRFSFPELVGVPSEVAGCALEVPGGRAVHAQPALDLAGIARAEFNDRVAGTLLKTVARALLKEGARKKAKKKSEGLGWLVNVINVATEQADTRGWIFLPGRIDILKTHLPEGPQTLQARFLDRQGEIVEEWELLLEIPRFGTRFVSLRSFR